MGNYPKGWKKMMEKDDYQHFVCIAAGNNPQELMAEYDKNTVVAQHVVYEHSKIPEIRGRFIEQYTMAMNEGLNETQKEYVRATIQDLAEMDDEEFLNELAEEENLIIDEEGNLCSTANPNGKWSSYTIGKLFSIPFITTDGREVFQAKKSEIDWPHVHLNGGEIYARAWEMVMDDAKPTNDYEVMVYENMRDKRHYFEKFGSKENYVTSNTAFWGYAFVSDKTGWIDASDNQDQFAWMSNFYDMFIKNLTDDTLLTIYECRK